MGGIDGSGIIGWVGIEDDEMIVVGGLGYDDFF